MPDLPPSSLSLYGLALSTVAHVPIDELPPELSRRMRGAAELLAVADVLELVPGSAAARRLSALLEFDPAGELSAVMLSEAATHLAVTDPAPELLEHRERVGIVRLAGVLDVLAGIRGLLAGTIADLTRLESAARRACAGVGDRIDLHRLWAPTRPAG